jgi:hypothetical protein
MKMMSIQKKREREHCHNERSSTEQIGPPCRAHEVRHCEEQKECRHDKHHRAISGVNQEYIPDSDRNKGKRLVNDTTGRKKRLILVQLKDPIARRTTLEDDCQSQMSWNKSRPKPRAFLKRTILVRSVDHGVMVQTPMALFIEEHRVERPSPESRTIAKSTIGSKPKPCPLGVITTAIVRSAM